MAKKKTYEESVERLKEIINLLENGNVSLEDSVKLFEEGTKLSEYCYKALENAKLKVTEVNTEENGE